MKKIILIAMVVALLVVPVQANAAGSNTANHWISWDKGGGTGGLYVGYWAGLMEMYFIVNVLEDASIRSSTGTLVVIARSCIPGKVTNGQLEKVMRKWLYENPSQRHMSMKVLIFKALREVYPCAPKTVL